MVGQLIEAQRAVTIERRIVGRWGPRLGEGPRALCATSRRRRRSPAAPRPNWPRWTSRRAGPRRCGGWRKVVAGGRCRLDSPAADRRLLAIPQIGPWTVQCLGLFGRGEMDSLPAGDLGYIKLVGRLAGLGRRATVAEVEEFYAPYEPYRGLVGVLTLAGLHRVVAQGPPLRLAA